MIIVLAIFICKRFAKVYLFKDGKIFSKTILTFILFITPVNFLSIPRDGHDPIAGRHYPQDD